MKGGIVMTIAVEVAKVAGWRETHFPGVNCRDIPAPPEPTLQELLDNTTAYARRRQKELSAELGLPRELTLMELLDDTLAWARATQKRLLAEFAEERRKRKNKK